MTIGQQLNKLPSPYNEMAMDNAIKSHPAMLVQDAMSFTEALYTAFTWADDSIGFEFWNAILENAKAENL